MFIITINPTTAAIIEGELNTPLDDYISPNGNYYMNEDEFINLVGQDNADHLTDQELATRQFVTE